MKKYNIIMDYILVLISFIAFSITFAMQYSMRLGTYKLLVLISCFYLFIFFIKGLVSLYTDKGLVRVN